MIVRRDCFTFAGEDSERSPNPEAKDFVGLSTALLKDALIELVRELDVFFSP